MKKKEKPKIKKQLLVFSFSTYFFSWLVWFPLILNFQFNLNLPTFPYQHFVGFLGPLFGVAFTILMTESKKDLENFVKENFKFKFSFVWYLLPFLLPFVFYGMGILVKFLATGVWVDLGEMGLSSGINFKNPIFSWIFWILLLGIGGEIGWRGFLLKKFREEFNTFESSLALASIWMAWHYPIFFYNEKFIAMGVSSLGWSLGLIANSIFLAWLTKKSKWSLIPAIIWQGTFNFLILSNQATGLITTIFTGFLILWVLALKFLPENFISFTEEKSND